MMKTRRIVASGLAILAVLATSVATIYAQTTAVGPYYAMPAWDQTLPCQTLANCPRFVVLSNFKSEGVLDRETGLVWQRTPSVESVDNWYVASRRCHQERTGGRTGWRLPSLEELQSLQESDGLNLTPGHPFTFTAVATSFWSATTVAGADPAGQPITNVAYTLNFASTGAQIPKVSTGFHKWCVRGGTGVAPY